MKELEIKPAYKHTKFGNFMFNLCARVAQSLAKHRWLYYLLACTWGILMTFIGLVISGVLGIAKLFNKKIIFKKYLWVYSISVGPDYWGGFETGLMFVRDQKSVDSLNAHEFGHTFQNCLFGPLFPFLVSIPSAIRYWYREIRYDEVAAPTDYDAIWFEDSATQCGKYIAKILNRK